MSTQTLTPNGIPEGFGRRLREERKRLKLSQTQLAQAGGIQRLAQLQYESEATSPTTRYLNLIASAGVDLSYLVLGIRYGEGQLSSEHAQRVEDQAFDWVAKCARTQPDGKFSPATHRMLFRLFRGCLTQIALGKLPADFDPTTLVEDQINDAERQRGGTHG